MQLVPFPQLWLLGEVAQKEAASPSPGTAAGTLQLSSNYSHHDSSYVSAIKITINLT